MKQVKWTKKIIFVRILMVFELLFEPVYLPSPNKPRFVAKYLLPCDEHCFPVSDPFAAASEGLNEGAQGGLIHIRIQQRNRRKTLTTVQGLPAEYDLKKIVKTCKKVRAVTYMFKLVNNNYPFRGH